MTQMNLTRRETSHGGPSPVVRLLRDLLDELDPNVLLVVFHLDIPGDRHPVVNDLGSAIRTLEHHVPALRAQRHLQVGISSVVFVLCRVVLCCVALG